MSLRRLETVIRTLAISGASSDFKEEAFSVRSFAGTADRQSRERIDPEKEASAPNAASADPDVVPALEYQLLYGPGCPQSPRRRGFDRTKHLKGLLRLLFPAGFAPRLSLS